MKNYSNDKNTILYISVRSDFGGGPQQLYKIILSLYKEYNVFVACPKNEPYYSLLAELIGVENIVEIPYRKFTLKAFYNILKKILWDNNIDLIHSHGKGAGVYSRLLSFFSAVPVVHTFHGIHVGELNWLQRNLYILMENCFGLLTKKSIFVSKSEFEQARKLGMGFYLNSVIIDNGVPIPKLDNNTLSNQSEIFTLLCVTRNSFQKNPDFLIDIAVQLKNNSMDNYYKICVVGVLDSELLIKRAFEEGVGHIIEWHEPSKNITPFFREAFCYLSTSRWEGMPLAVLEAMSFGMPVIASDVVGNRDIIVDGKSGYLYSLKSIEKVILILQNLSKNKKLRDSMGAFARKQVEDLYSEKTMITRTNQIYQESMKLHSD